MGLFAALLLIMPALHSMHALVLLVLSSRL